MSFLVKPLHDQISRLTQQTSTQLTQIKTRERADISSLQAKSSD
jgi:hypothetical protein